MADSLRFGGFKVNRAGVVAALKSGGARAVVAGHARRICSAANAMARDAVTEDERNMLEALEPGCMYGDPYEVELKGDRDTLGVVRSASLWGAYDSNRHHTLDALNH